MREHSYAIHTHISSEHKLLDLKLKEVWQYRDLILMFTRRTFTVQYKQTILGPLWLFITPLMTSTVYVVLFGNIAHLSTDGIPQLLFYLSGNAIWSYYNACLVKNASTFTSNSGMFGKVYFPRLSIPIATILSSMIRFGIQMILVIILLVFYVLRGAVVIHPLSWLFIPLILIWLGVMGMGFGIILSSVTTKYRDLSILVDFGMSLWMYATPVVYPLSTVSGPLRIILLCNPVTMPIEIFRFAVLGTGTIVPGYIALSIAITFAVTFIGIIIFNRVERTFMDTV